MTACPSYSEQAQNPAGVPISAIIFGGRRESLVPLVFEARDWAHGVLLGAAMASETTAAATGAVGVVRRDPMAMKPFCGLNFGDYWAHWLKVGSQLTHAPKIFNVNWFRKGSDGKFLWPGFSDNLRVLAWALKRCGGTVGAQPSAIGNVPHAQDLELSGLNLSTDALNTLLHVEQSAWQTEVEEIGVFLAEYGTRTPYALQLELAKARAALGTLAKAA